MSVTTLTKKDLTSDQEVRWCPGCGDYSILANVQRLLPELGVPRENMVFISGIGCSSRFPYYMNTFGMHTIHGRAPAFASGLKVARPDLSVWIITGDGDGFSIGGNHMLHILRRNIDVNILLVNNRIYGLTKGQYSPTSEEGKVTKSTPVGSVDHPINPVRIALGAEASFVARALDVDAKGLTSVLKAAAFHKGTSFVEIYQNCNIFNDGAFGHLSDRKLRDDNTITLADGEPLVFGASKEKGIRLNGLEPEVVSSESGDLLRHDSRSDNLAHILAGLDHPRFPVPLGVIRSVERPVYEESLAAQNRSVIEKKGAGRLEDLLASGQTWDVK